MGLALPGKRGGGMDSGQLSSLHLARQPTPGMKCSAHFGVPDRDNEEHPSCGGSLQ